MILDGVGWFCWLITPPPEKSRNISIEVGGQNEVPGFGEILVRQNIARELYWRTNDGHVCCTHDQSINQFDRLIDLLIIRLGDRSIVRSDRSLDRPIDQWSLDLSIGRSIDQWIYSSFTISDLINFSKILSMPDVILFTSNGGFPKQFLTKFRIISEFFVYIF